MSDQKEKIFCGSGWIKNFENGGSLVNIIVELDNIPERFIKDGDYGREVRLQVCDIRNPKDEEGAKTHYLLVNQYDGQSKGQTPTPPRKGPERTHKPRTAPPPASVPEEDDLPF